MRPKDWTVIAYSANTNENKTLPVKATGSLDACKKAARAFHVAGCARDLIVLGAIKGKHELVCMAMVFGSAFVSDICGQPRLSPKTCPGHEPQRNAERSPLMPTCTAVATCSCSRSIPPPPINGSRKTSRPRDGNGWAPGSRLTIIAPWTSPAAWTPPA